MFCTVTKYLAYLLTFCVLASTKKIFNSKNLPVIIWWTDLLYPREESSSEVKCYLGSCIVSKRRYYHNDDVMISYLFYGTDFDGEKLPLPRRKNHIWTLLHEESPMNNYIFSHLVGINLFNYTGTFSRYSDFPLTTQFIPSIAYLVDRKPVPVAEKNNFRRIGTAPVLYLQSHCGVASDRDRYVKELMKYIHVDSLGACLHNKDLPSDLSSTGTHNDEELFTYISRYKFQIAFENAICDDYITEKLFRTLHIGVVPIYKGSPSVKDWIPSTKSVILIDDFEDPSALASFILQLDQNDDLYSEYLLYKEQGITNDYLKDQLLKRTWGVNDPNVLDFIQSFECFVCDKIRNLPFSPIANEGHMNCPESQKSLASKNPSQIGDEFCDKIENLPLLSVANQRHMNCPEPQVSLPSKSLFQTSDEWMKENWSDIYWFAYDQAKAIELMLHHKEKNSSNFIKYLSKLKYYG